MNPISHHLIISLGNDLLLHCTLINIIFASTLDNDLGNHHMIVLLGMQWTPIPQ